MYQVNRNVSAPDKNIFWCQTMPSHTCATKIYKMRVHLAKISYDVTFYPAKFNEIKLHMFGVKIYYRTFLSSKNKSNFNLKGLLSIYVRTFYPAKVCQNKDYVKHQTLAKYVVMQYLVNIYHIKLSCLIITQCSGYLVR